MHEPFEVSAQGVTAPPLGPAFLRRPSITDDVTPYPASRSEFTVQLRHQVTFNLPAGLPDASMRSLVVAGRTHFEDDFIVRGLKVIWQRGVLPLGTELLFESLGTNQRHWRQVRFIARPADAGRFELWTAPAGTHIEVFHNQRYHDEASGLFRVQGHYLTWLGPLAAGDELVVRYATSPEGAALWHTHHWRLAPGHPNHFALAVDTLSPIGRAGRLYFRGLRLKEGVDYFVTDDRLWLLREDLLAQHGEILTYVQPTSETHFQRMNASGRITSNVLAVSHRALDADTALVADLRNPGVKGLLGVNGLLAAEGHGFLHLMHRYLLWLDGPYVLKEDDALTLIAVYPQYAQGVHISRVPVTEEYPTWTLARKSADIRKSLVLVSAANRPGGACYAGTGALAFIDERTLAWRGEFPLAPTDMVVVVSLVHPALASSFELAQFAITEAQAGTNVCVPLPRTPREPHAVLAALNGVQLVSGRDFSVTDAHFTYYADASGIPPKVNDRLTVWFR
jgi:hypothetical protein